jgi:hypothetical protein
MCGYRNYVHTNNQCALWEILGRGTQRWNLFETKFLDWYHSIYTRVFKWISFCCILELQYIICSPFNTWILAGVWAVLWSWDPQSKFKDSKQWKGTCIKWNTSSEPFGMRIGPKCRPVGWMRKRKKEKGRTKSQHSDISPPRGGAIWQPTCTKFGAFVELTEIVTHAKFGWFSRPIGGENHFSL